MHQLRRVAVPACLTRYRHGRDKWGPGLPTSAEKAAIWAALDEMQGGRCAYCEADISVTDRHIEHFRQRSRHPKDTFAWDNLFGSCNREDSCGKHKDRCGAYASEALIKPDVDDPERFLLFVSDGTVVPRRELNAAERFRAEETLRVFNLNAKSGALRYQRQQAAAGYLQTAELLRELAGENPEALLALLQEEVAATEHLPFATAIKQVLLP